MLRSRFVTLYLAAALSVVGVGCADTPGPSIFITGNLSSDDMCIYKVGNALVLRAVFDVCRGGGAGRYLFAPQYTNQLLRRDSLGPFRADPNGFQVQGAEILLVDQTGATIGFPGLPNPFTVMAGDYIPPASTTGPGVGIGAIDAIPESYGVVMRDVVGDRGTIGARVSVFGETNGGLDVDGVEWHLPIDLCCGCLGFCPMMGESVASCPNGPWPISDPTICP